MRVKFLAVVAMLMLAAPVTASAFDDTVTASKGTGFDHLFSQVFSLVAGSYNFGLTVGPHSNPSSNPSGTITATLLDSLNNAVAQLTGTTSNGATASSSSLLSLSAGNYKIAWSGAASKATIQGVASVNVQAVPGPEAGAGLGALTMGGIALWLKRRRRDEDLTT
ncbi:hypothetical protein EV130_12038 [Rhizobium azibense]|uniref:Secreted protein with PEP-CTERM sorting signal n=1 Tax=Rhizobium azibense TaxID=1136135 RepID=A0A4R3Q5A3_9HYPH|nr:hypothetical protein [Rhizobium azibense]TCU15654.1 hypothetical protein EV130_12038 [Rhizobium azibense]